MVDQPEDNEQLNAGEQQSDANEQPDAEHPGLQSQPVESSDQVAPPPGDATPPEHAHEAADTTKSEADPSSIKEPSMGYAQTDEQATSAHPVEFPDLGDSAMSVESGNIDMLLDVELPVAIELGRTKMPIAEILRWGQGSIVELDKLAGEPVDLLVNNKIVATGEVVVIDENFGLRITHLLGYEKPG